MKKGQTLINNDRGVNARAHKDPNQAVVLTLRKRYSVSARRGSRVPTAGGETIALGGPSSTNQLDPTVVSNPWEDAVNPRQRSHTLSHRLSYDHASGVIMLPDDGDWIEADDDDSDEEDYGIENGGLERSLTESMVSSPVEEGNGGQQLRQPALSSSPTASTPSRMSRYGTYFHHPERRRLQIPGAFPRS